MRETERIRCPRSGDSVWGIVARFSRTQLKSQLHPAAGPSAAQAGDDDSQAENAANQHGSLPDRPYRRGPSDLAFSQVQPGRFWVAHAPFPARLSASARASDAPMLR